jgi:hypothetical protein
MIAFPIPLDQLGSLSQAAASVMRLQWSTIMQAPVRQHASLTRRQFLKVFSAACTVGGPAVALGAESLPSDSTRDTTGFPHRPLGKTGVRVSALALGGVIGMQLKTNVRLVREATPMTFAERRELEAAMG